MPTLQSEFGTIDFDIQGPNEKYPNGLLLFMGSHIEKQYRGKGHFKEMVNDLFTLMPKNTQVQVALANKKLIPFFKRMGFQETDWIEYWGSTTNTIKLVGYIN